MIHPENEATASLLPERSRPAAAPAPASAAAAAAPLLLAPADLPAVLSPAPALPTGDISRHPDKTPQLATEGAAPAVPGSSPSADDGPLIQAEGSQPALAPAVVQLSGGLPMSGSEIAAAILYAGVLGAGGAGLLIVSRRRI